VIISHQHKYLFIELPHTASTAISQELCENYAGESVLHKHALPHEFFKTASAEEKEYFVFAGIRNPLDLVITVYFKYKTNHQGFFTDPKYWRRNGGHVTDAALRKFRFVQDNADFGAYFKKFFRTPYSGWGSLSPQELGFVIRFENLQDDFAEALALLGLEQVRPLPVVNKTSGRGDDFGQYYTPDMYARARWVFGPYLKRWGYSFPPEWGNDRVPWLSQMLFNAIILLKRGAAPLVGGGLMP
jgi:hypothetical protein